MTAVYLIIAAAIFFGAISIARKIYSPDGALAVSAAGFFIAMYIIMNLA